MSKVKDRREVARLTVRGREFWVERIVWKDSTGLSFDVYDAATDQCLTAESFDNQPREGDVDTLLGQLTDDLDGGTLDRFFDDDETKATLAEILAPAGDGLGDQVR